ncbi:MAG: DAK2 domain-containing protein [Firmicutes bacterium]|nr:DAK2 domain-containing protein [Bacillota bacterium]
MTSEGVTGEQVKQLFEGGLAFLAEKQKEIDRLNVFPVPDGDTGRNMYLTLVAAVKEAQKVKTSSIGKVGEALAKGSLMGARGNSGVILSQLIRGLAEAVKGKERVTFQEFAKAWQAAVATAYRAVIKPVEGTMLTVAHGVARGFSEAATTARDLGEILSRAIQRGSEALQRTPDLLPVLKKAGVVDAGGKGLLVILEGGLKSLLDGRLSPSEARVSLGLEQPSLPTGEGDFTCLYCVEFLLRGKPFPKSQFQAGLQELGESLLIGGGGDLTRIHIHTNHPGKVLEHCLQFGTLHNIQISNMRDQWEESMREGEEEQPPGAGAGDPAPNPAQIGIVAVASGEGIKKIFFNLGVDQIIEGGQTMNPPVEEFVNAIEQVPAPQVLVLPNNKNLILAAEQAKQLVNRAVEVIPSHSVPAGIAALLSFNPSSSLQENRDKMTRHLAQVKVGEVTYAVRDAASKGIFIKEGDLIGLHGREIVAAGSSLDQVVLELIDRMLAEGDGLITLYAGKDVAGEEAEKIAGQVRARYPEQEVELHYGGQPVYYFLIGIE